MACLRPLFWLVKNENHSQLDFFTMFVDSAILQDENTRRMGLGAFGALTLHALIVAWFALPVSKNMLSADLYSPPTNVTIRFTQPVKKEIVPEKPVEEIKKVEPVKKTPAKKIAKVTPVKPKPEVLNTIEPAAHQPPEQVTKPAPVEPVAMTPPKPAPQSIPVVTEVNLKGRRVRPQYPKRALKLRQEGTVLLRVLVSKDGDQETLKIYRPSQYALLNQAAVKAVKKWKFEPTRRGGIPVKSWVEIPIEFAIQ